jgi:hypothetical protein
MPAVGTSCGAFYETEVALPNCRRVSGEGLSMGQPALVMATPEHRRGIVDGSRASFRRPRMRRRATW